MGKTAITMKRDNINIVRRALYKSKVSTIRDLAQATGLSVATVGNILTILMESGEALIGNAAPSTGGRPSQSYLFNSEYAYILALSARAKPEAEVINASIANLFGEIVWHKAYVQRTIGIRSFEVVIDQCLKEYPTIQTLAFSLPGVEQDGVVLSSDYKELEGARFIEHFKARYDLPMLIENDINSAVAGYAQASKVSTAVVGIYFPGRYMPGAGIWINGHILRGVSGNAGEICFMPLGIDWLSVDYFDAPEIGPAVSKLVSAVCSVINPGHVVLYGDFFTDIVQKTVQSAIEKQMVRSMIPSIDYKAEPDDDITLGLLAQARTLYQRQREVFA